MLDSICAVATTGINWWTGGGLISSTTVVVLLMRHLSNRKIHMNGASYVDENVCMEKHKSMSERILGVMRYAQAEG